MKVSKNSIYGMFGESQDTERDRINYLMETHSFTLSKRYSYRDVEKYVVTVHILTLVCTLA